MALRATNDNIGMSMHFSDADPIAVCLVLGCQMHFHGDSRNDAMLAWSAHVSKDHREDWETEVTPPMVQRPRFNINILGKRVISGSAEIDKYGELQLYVMDTATPLLLDIAMTCKIENVTLAFDIKPARSWVESSEETREIMRKGEPE
jgi:hypothetical protein